MKKIALFSMIFMLILSIATVGVACSKLELAKPDNIKYDGNTITWNPVENASYYTVQVDGGDLWEVTETQLPYQANGKSFTVKITAVSEAKKIVKSGESLKTFTPLNSIAEVRVNEDGSIEWDAVENATGYYVKIGAEEILTTDTFYSEIPEGAHSVNVKPVIDGNDAYYSSYMTKSVSVIICGTVNETTISYFDGVISWSSVKNASAYEVSVNGAVLSDNCKSTSIAYDSKNQNFEVKIKAIGNHATTFDGKDSEVKKFVYLDTVTNVTVENGIVKWNEINNATGYKIKLNGIVWPKILTSNEFDGLSVNTTTDIQIMPITEDTSYFSSWSTSKSVFLLSAPVLQWEGSYQLDGEANNNLFWDAVNGAYGYVVKLTYPGGAQKEFAYGETQRNFSEAYLASGTYTVEVKAQASASASGVYDSKYSKAIQITRLEAPLAVSENFIVSNPANQQEGFTVTFKKVSGATGYRLYKDNNAHMTSNNNQFNVTGVADSASTEEQTFNYKIQSIGTLKTENGQIKVLLDSLSANALSFKITVLATPSSPSISGFTYSYGSIDKNNGYVIDVDGQSYTSGETSYDLSMLMAGDYDVSVCAKGNSADVLASNYTAPINVLRLEAPSNVRIDTQDASEGVLTYNGVLNATGYYVVFNNDGNAINADTLGNMNQYISEQGTSVYMLSSANYYNEAGTTYYMTSLPGKTNTFIKLTAPTFGDIAFSSTQLIWNASSNINTNVYTPTYEVYYPNGTTYNGEKNGTSMDISYLEGGQSYTFRVKAIGDGVNYINSEKSVSVSIYKISTPTVSKADGKYVWNAVPNAVNYVVYVDGKEMSKDVHVSGSSYSFTPKFNEIKEYTVEVQAIGDGGYTSINSNKATIIQQTKQLSTPGFKLSYSSDSYDATGTINVTITEEPLNATGYSYTVGGVTKTSSETTYSYCPNNVGVYAASVYAIGGKFDDEGVYWIDSQRQSGSNYKITLLASPNPDSWKLSADGLLTWPPISGMVSYEIEIAVNGGEYTTYTQTSTSMVIEDYSIRNSYKIRIRAKGNGTTIISSVWSEHTWDAM